MASATYQELREALARLVAEAEERMPCREGARRVLRQPCAACHCGLRAEADQRGRERAEAEARSPLPPTGAPILTRTSRATRRVASPVRPGATTKGLTSNSVTPAAARAGFARPRAFSPWNGPVRAAASHGNRLRWTAASSSGVRFRFSTYYNHWQYCAACAARRIIWV